MDMTNLLFGGSGLIFPENGLLGAGVTADDISNAEAGAFKGVLNELMTSVSRKAAAVDTVTGNTVAAADVKIPEKDTEKLSIKFVTEKAMSPAAERTLKYMAGSFLETAKNAQDSLYGSVFSDMTALSGIETEDGKDSKDYTDVWKKLFENLSGEDFSQVSAFSAELSTALFGKGRDRKKTSESILSDFFDVMSVRNKAEVIGKSGLVTETLMLSAGSGLFIDYAQNEKPEDTSDDIDDILSALMEETDSETAEAFSEELSLAVAAAAEAFDYASAYTVTYEADGDTVSEIASVTDIPDKTADAYTYAPEDTDEAEYSAGTAENKAQVYDAYGKPTAEDTYEPKETQTYKARYETDVPVKPENKPEAETEKAVVYESTAEAAPQVNETAVPERNVSEMADKAQDAVIARPETESVFRPSEASHTYSGTVSETDGNKERTAETIPNPNTAEKITSEFTANTETANVPSTDTAVKDNNEYAAVRAADTEPENEADILPRDNRVTESNVILSNRDSAESNTVPLAVKPETAEENVIPQTAEASENIAESLIPEPEIRLETAEIAEIKETETQTADIVPQTDEPTETEEVRYESVKTVDVTDNVSLTDKNTESAVVPQVSQELRTAPVPEETVYIESGEYAEVSRIYFEEDKVSPAEDTRTEKISEAPVPEYGTDNMKTEKTDILPHKAERPVKNTGTAIPRKTGFADADMQAAFCRMRGGAPVRPEFVRKTENVLPRINLSPSKDKDSDDKDMADVIPVVIPKHTAAEKTDIQQTEIIPEDRYNTIEQILAKLERQTENIAPLRSRELTIKLSPETLGEITVRISKDIRGAVEITLAAQNHSVRELISAHASELAQSLSDKGEAVSGINVVNPAEAGSNMAFDMNGGNNNSAFNFRQQGFGYHYRTDRVNAAEEEAAAEEQQIKATEEIDYISRRAKLWTII